MSQTITVTPASGTTAASVSLNATTSIGDIIGTLFNSNEAVTGMYKYVQLALLFGAGYMVSNVAHGYGAFSLRA